jgi:hypothetical protein
MASFANLSKHERGYLDALGIDETMGTRIAVQIEKHGIREKDIFDLNTRAWDDRLARRAIAGALDRGDWRCIRDFRPATLGAVQYGPDATVLPALRRFGLAAVTTVPSARRAKTLGWFPSPGNPFRDDGPLSETHSKWRF